MNNKIAYKQYDKIIKVIENQTKEEKDFNCLSIMNYLFINNDKPTRQFLLEELTKLNIRINKNEDLKK